MLRAGKSVWELRVEASRITKQLDDVRKRIRALERERALKTLKKLPPHQRRVLAAFMDEGQGGWCDELCYGFHTVAAWTGLTRNQVSRACRALRRYGFLSFHRGLFNEDGEVAGSGYGLTKAGASWWNTHEQPPEDGSQPSQPVHGEVARGESPEDTTEPNPPNPTDGTVVSSRSGG